MTYPTRMPTSTPCSGATSRNRSRTLPLGAGFSITFPVGPLGLDGDLGRFRGIRSHVTGLHDPISGLAGVPERRRRPARPRAWGASRGGRTAGRWRSLLAPRPSGSLLGVGGGPCGPGRWRGWRRGGRPATTVGPAFRALGEAGCCTRDRRDFLQQLERLDVMIEFFLADLRGRADHDRLIEPVADEEDPRLSRSLLGRRRCVDCEADLAARVAVESDWALALNGPLPFAAHASDAAVEQGVGIA